MLGGASSVNELVLVAMDSNDRSNSGVCKHRTNEMERKIVNLSPKSRSKSQGVLWLKSALQELGSAVFDENKAGYSIDRCYQAPLPPLQKLCVAVVRGSRKSTNIANTMPFNKILRNICSVRSEYVMRICKPILLKLMAHDRNRNVFNHPVDPVELGIPNYFLVIKRPMDLGTVMSNLRGGVYYTVKACFDDIELTFQNAMTFNPLPHEVHKMAKDLLADLNNEMMATEEKCIKDSDKKSNHSCTLCCGSTCQLCGEKCLKYEPPSLNCQQCSTRVKKNAFFYVCSDGSALWCQKCYIALPPVIVSAAPRPLHSVDSSADVTTESAADISAEQTISNSNVNFETDGLMNSNEFDLTELPGGSESAEPTCGVSTSDADSSHGAFCPPLNADSNGAAEPLLKRQLLKRRADEEVAEPWVACDSCGNWYHQVCAFFTTLTDMPTKSKTFCCPYCVVLVGCQQMGVDMDSCLSVGPLRRTSEDRTSATAMDVIQVPEDYVESPESIQRLKSQLAVKFQLDGLFKNIFEYSALSSPNKSETKEPVMVEMVESDDGEGFTVTISSSTGSDCNGDIKNNANSSCVSTGSLSEGEMLVRSCESDYESDASCSGRRVHDDFCEDDITVMEDASSDNNKDSVCSTEIDTRVHQVMPSAEPCPTPTKGPFLSPLMAPSPVSWRQDDTAGAPVQAQSPVDLDPHWKWRASSLPHTQLGDFLEKLVQDLLITNGYADAADRITIRMTSNHDRALEVPTSIVDNLIAPSGHCIPTCMGYKQKCVLLFQEIDGVDVCLFSLYVHEFDAQCPSPNTSTVYIAYLDSVDYFRPISARTMVYQEIVAGYLKWSQARGFKQAHIWSCPPHRGDNFIFNAHPAHQKYPSRERLNHWYKSILQRCSKLGIISETGNLWQQYFSKYVRRDAVPVARQAAKNSFVGSGKAVKKTNAKAKKKGGVPLPAVLLPAPGNHDASAGEQAVDDAKILVATASAPGTAVTACLNPNDPSSDAPVCPPIFDGDYWVQQYVYLVRLHTQKTKAQSSAAQRQHQSVRKFRDLLKRLMVREESAAFLHPVDHIALDIPNYTLVVKQPMDFSTIKEKLGAGEYQTALHFVNDVRLVFLNAKLFNPPDHIVYMNAESLSSRFEKGLQLVMNELQELNGTGLLRMPIPGEDGGTSTEQMLEKIVLSTKFISVAADSVEIVSSVEEGSINCEYSSNTAVNTVVPHFGTADLAFDCSSHGSSTITTTRGLHVETDTVVPLTVNAFNTPVCTTVSRSGSLVDEQEFAQSDALLQFPSDYRPRAQSISITPTAKPQNAVRTPLNTELVEFSDTELDSSDASERELQHVVSQDFGRTNLLQVADDDATKKKKKLEWDCAYKSPESEAKRRKISMQPAEDVRTASDEHKDAELLASAAKSLEFRADTLNMSHRPVAFASPVLGSQNTMTIVAELSKRMQRQYDDLFVIKLACPEVCTPDEELRRSSSPTATSGAGPATASAAGKKPRGRVPAMYLHGGLKGLSPDCRDMLRSLAPDTSDPDPFIRSPVTDSRHTFLELCQFRHYQFDSLRRAKYSSLMLLYHLQHPHGKSCRPCCSHCDETIHTLRWHCDECPDFDLCRSCYAADQAKGSLSSSGGSEVEAPAQHTSPRARANSLRQGTHHHHRVNAQVPAAPRPHAHTLTPYRVSIP